jgi:hypothetical protein
LANKLESKHIDISPIVEKMSQVGDDFSTFKNKVKMFQKHEPIIVNLDNLPPNITSTHDK